MGIGVIERALHWRERLRTRLFTWLIASQFREIGSGSRISPPFRFWGLHQISIGEMVMVHQFIWIQAIGDEGSNEAAKIIIKSHARIGMGAHISAVRQIVIGEHVMLGRNVYISDHLHGYKDTTTLIANQGIDDIKPVSIGRGSWLGNNVAVLPGASIGEHCVIGVNSVVSTPVPDFSVAVGMPARVVRNLRPNSAKTEI